MIDVTKNGCVPGRDGEIISFSYFDSGVKDPNSMAPRCSTLWEWYRTVAPRLRSALMNRDGTAVEGIAEEIEAHAVEIEYQCRI